MSRSFIIFASFVLIVLIALAQKFGPSIVDAQISFYQSQIDAGCRARGRERGSPAEAVDAFCSCMIKTLKQQVTSLDWERAYTFALQGRHAEETQVLEPYDDQLKKACK